MVGTKLVRARLWWTLPLKAVAAVVGGYCLYCVREVAFDATGSMSPFTVAHIAAILFVVFTYLGRNHVGRVDVPLEKARAMLLRYMKDESMVWSEARGRMTVRLGGYPSVKIVLRKSENGTEVFFTPHATPRGQVLVALFLVFSWGFPVSIVLSLGFVRASRRFALRILSVLSDPDSAVDRGDTKELIETSLFEARRIALETSEARRSQYELRLAVLVIAWPVTSLVVGILPLLVQGVGWPDHRLWFFCSITVVSVMALYGAIRLRRRAMPEIHELRGWVIRIESQLAAERSGEPFDDPAETSFDVLAAVGRELPVWLSIRRRSGLFSPWMTALTALFGLSALGLLTIGLTYTPYDASVNVPLTIAGMVMGALVILTFRWVRRMNRSESVEFCEKWKGRWDAMMADGENLLEGQ